MSEKPRNVADLVGVVDEEPEAPVVEKAPLEEVQEDEQGGDIPSWALPAIPQGMRFPPGKAVAFMRVRSSWTDSPQKGVQSIWRRPRDPRDLAAGFDSEEVLSRVAICWSITYGEERNALKRSREPTMTYDELTKQMIRAVDGRKVDWAGEYAKPENAGSLVSPEEFWRDLGVKCRPLFIAQYRQLHNLKEEELADFLSSSLVVVRAVGG